MTTDRRFAFVEALNDGSQKLMLAELDQKPGRPLPRTAHIVRQMATQPGEQPTDGNTPQSFRLLVPSRSNAYLAALSVQWGYDFIDLNVEIYDQATGNAVIGFNEHRFTDTHRSNCVSPVFDALLAQEAANGVSAADLAAYDYSIDAENIPAQTPELIWTTDETLIVRYSYDVLVTPLNFSPGTDSFEFEVAPVAPFTLLSRNANKRPNTPPPADYFSLLLVRGGREIAFHKALLPFKPLSRLPSWFPWPSFTSYRKAEIVVGYAR